MRGATPAAAREGTEGAEEQSQERRRGETGRELGAIVVTAVKWDRIVSAEWAAKE